MNATTEMLVMMKTRGTIYLEINLLRVVMVMMMVMMMLMIVLMMTVYRI